VFASACVTAPITHFISFEVRNFTHRLGRLRSFATVWPWAFIAALRIVTVIYVALELGMPVEPGAGANEHPIGKPFRTVVAIRSTFIRSVVIVTVRAFRRDSYVDADLSLCFGSGYYETNSSHGDNCKKCESVHESSLSIGKKVKSPDHCTVTRRSRAKLARPRS
jgi:hypothetical protein